MGLSGDIKVEVILIRCKPFIFVIHSRYFLLLALLAQGGIPLLSSEYDANVVGEHFLEPDKSASEADAVVFQSVEFTIDNDVPVTVSASGVEAMITLTITQDFLELGESIIYEAYCLNPDSTFGGPPLASGSLFGPLNTNDTRVFFPFITDECVYDLGMVVVIRQDTVLDPMDIDPIQIDTVFAFTPATLVCPDNFSEATCSLDETPVFQSVNDFIAAGGVATGYCQDFDELTIELISETNDGASCFQLVSRMYVISDTCGRTDTCTHEISLLKAEPVDFINPNDTVFLSCANDFVPEFLELADNICLGLQIEEFVSSFEEECPGQASFVVAYVGSEFGCENLADTFFRTFVYEDACPTRPGARSPTDFSPRQISLGPDKLVCGDVELEVTNPGECPILNGTWMIISGSGELSDTLGQRVTYTPNPGVETETVVIAYTTTDPRGPYTPDSDTIQLFVGDPFFNCKAAINISCGQEVTVEDVLAFDFDEDISGIFRLDLYDRLGAPLSNPVPLDYRGEFKAVLTSRCNGIQCESIGVVESEKKCVIRNTLDTTVWCVDEFLFLDPLSDEYPLSRPFAADPCNDDVFQAVYDGEWSEEFDCGDTLKLITRRWSYETRDDYVCESYDSIFVIRLPDIRNHLVAPSHVDVYCELQDRGEILEYETEYFSWRQLLGIHSDENVVRYPIRNSVYTDIAEIISSLSFLADRELRDSVENRLRGIPVVRDYDQTSDSYVDYSIFDIWSNASDLFPREGSFPEYALFSLEIGDQFLTADGSYLTADESWLFAADSQGVWYDISIPSVSGEIIRDTCDVWALETCGSLSLLLPDHPYAPNTCELFCLDKEAVESIKCLGVLDDQVQDHGTTCPGGATTRLELLQSCFATGVASLDGIANCQLDTNTSGLVSFEEDIAGLRLVIEQSVVLVDTLAPLVYGKSREAVFATDPTSCISRVSVPDLLVKDLCSGVKEVRATVGLNNPWVMLERVEGTDQWRHVDNQLTLACGGPYIVRYDVQDSCHNSITLERNSIVVVDQTPPLGSTDDSLVVSINDKYGIVPIEAIDEGSEDNCGIVRRLIRRPDWATMCDVDLCTPDLAGFTTQQQVDSYIRQNGLMVGMTDNDIERIYAEQYEWLFSDGEWCDNEQLNSTRNLLLRGWEEEVKRVWSRECGLQDELGFPLYDEETNAGRLGGGWSDRIIVCCEDVCKDIVVEMLLIDKNCNYTLTWTIIRVIDQSTVTKVQDFDPVQIACSSYEQNYARFIDSVVGGAEMAIHDLDDVFGALAIGFDDGNGGVQTSQGTPLPLSQVIQTRQCSLVTSSIDIIGETLKDGNVVIETEETSEKVLFETSYTVLLGAVTQECGSSIEKEVIVDLDECGLGTITRRWFVYGGCSSDGHRGLQPIVMEQIIQIVPDCELDRFSLNIPDDVVVCDSIVFDEQTNVILEVDTLTYGLDDLTCRDLGISYRDRVIDAYGVQGLWKVERTWIVQDWCTGEKVEVQQTIVVDQRCVDTSIVNGVRGRVLRRDGITGVEGVRLRALGTDRYAITDENGRFEIQGKDMIIVPDKEAGMLQEGLDVIDLVEIRKYILGHEEPTIEEATAADINADQTVNTKDIMHGTEVILEKRDYFPNNANWRFFESVTGNGIYFQKPESGLQDVEFMGIKTGDVVESSEQLSRSSRSMKLQIDDQEISKGEVRKIYFQFSEELTGFQFSLAMDTLKIDVHDVEGEDGSVTQWSRNVYGVQVVTSGSALKGFSIVIKAIDDVKLSHAMHLDYESDFRSMGVDGDYPIHDLQLNFSKEEQVILKQNVPNPFSDQTTFEYYLPRAGEVVFSLFDTYGRLIDSHTGYNSAGSHSFTIDRFVSSHMRDGVYFLQLQYEGESWTQTMIKVNR